MEALKGLVNLTSLSLQLNGIGAKGAQALQSLVSLTALDLSSQPFAMDRRYDAPLKLEPLESGTTLASMMLWVTGIGDVNRIGPVGAQALKGLFNLTSLNLGYNGIGSEGAQALKSLVNLTSLGLRKNSIGFAGVQAIRGLVNLASLDLRSNELSAKGAQPLKDLVNLTTLDLSNSGVEDLSPLVRPCRLRQWRNRF
jgi:Leucine-rich repeat (LRR) protein